MFMRRVFPEAFLSTADFLTTLLPWPMSWNSQRLSYPQYQRSLPLIRPHYLPRPGSPSHKIFLYGSYDGRNNSCMHQKSPRWDLVYFSAENAKNQQSSKVF